MTIGTWYYPKNWPRSEWADDIETIASAGFEHVRMGVFYWSRVEPRRGEFDFEWLATALDLFETHNIDVVLGTPTGARTSSGRTRAESNTTGRRSTGEVSTIGGRC